MREAICIATYSESIGSSLIFRNGLLTRKFHLSRFAFVLYVLTCRSSLMY